MLFLFTCFNLFAMPCEHLINAYIKGEIVFYSASLTVAWRYFESRLWEILWILEQIINLISQGFQA